MTALSKGMNVGVGVLVIVGLLVGVPVGPSVDVGEAVTLAEADAVAVARAVDDAVSVGVRVSGFETMDGIFRPETAANSNASRTTAMRPAMSPRRRGALGAAGGPASVAR
jgi:hypothetical protein